MVCHQSKTKTPVVVIGHARKMRTPTPLGYYKTLFQQNLRSLHSLFTQLTVGMNLQTNQKKKKEAKNSISVFFN